MIDRGKEAIVDARVSKVLSLRTDTAALLEALDCIGPFFTQNTVEARRSLRHDVENQNLLLSGQFLGKVIDISNDVKLLQNHACQLNDCCKTYRKFYY